MHPKTSICTKNINEQSDLCSIRMCKFDFVEWILHLVFSETLLIMKTFFMALLNIMINLLLLKNTWCEINFVLSNLLYKQTLFLYILLEIDFESSIFIINDFCLNIIFSKLNLKLQCCFDIQIIYSIIKVDEQPA